MKQIKPMSMVRYKVLSCLLLFAFIYIYILYDDVTFSLSLQVVSQIGVLLIGFIVYSWFRTHPRILCPYIVFVVSLYLVLCGQSLCWAFGVSAGSRELMLQRYMDVFFTKKQACMSLLYSYVCIATLHLTVMLSPSDRIGQHCVFLASFRKENQVISSEIRYQAILYVALILISLSIIPYFWNSIKTISLMDNGSYTEQYEVSTRVTGIASITRYLSDYFQVGLFLLFLIFGKESKFNMKGLYLKRATTYLLLSLFLVLELKMGHRTSIILLFVTVLLIFFKERKLKKIELILFLSIGLIGMAGMRMIDMLRSQYIAEFKDFIGYIKSNNNPVIDFLGDIGWNLFSTIQVQRLVPSYHPYSYGLSYLMATTSVIPNLNFWPIHPSSTYASLGDWLQKCMNLSYGPGFSPVAESYYNFGSWGWLVFLLWGKLVITINKYFEQAEAYDFRGVFALLFVGIILKSAVRSTFLATFRGSLLYVFIPVIAIWIIAKVLQERSMYYSLKREQVI